jgi:hypothetical protein
MLKDRRGWGRGWCTLAVSAACAFGVFAGTVSAQDGPASIGDALGLSDFTIVSLEVPAEAGSYVEVPITIDETPTALRLFKHSMRSPDFKVLVSNDTGGLDEAPAPPKHTYRGMLLGVRASRVAASVRDGQVRAWITIGDKIHAVQPLTDADPSADPSLHVLYGADDLVPGDWSCGVQANLIDQVVHEFETMPTGGGTKLCEIAFDTDFEYYQQNGQSVPNTIADIELVLNAVENIYIGQVGIEYEITTIIVRTNVNDPYTTFVPETFLSQFQQHWINNQGAVERDVAHLMTGKNLNGSIIGISFGGGICSKIFGYSLSQTKFSNNLAFRAALSAHEIGHDWTAQHCDGDPDCAIMCSVIAGCPGGIFTFGSAAKAKINQLKDFAQCLDDIVPFEGFANWTYDYTTDDGDNLVDFGETATVTLTLDFDPDIDEVTYLGFAASIFDVIGDGGAAKGHITGWNVLNNLADLTGDLTTTDGTSLFGVNAGQLTGFGPFTPADPLDVIEFGWTADDNEDFGVTYQTVTESMFVWEPGDGGGEEALEWLPVEVEIVFPAFEGDDCPADCNGDGVLNILDFVCFQGEWQNQTSLGDCDNNGLYNILDFVCFQGEFVAGCP